MCSIGFYLSIPPSIKRHSFSHVGLKWNRSRWPTVPAAHSQQMWALQCDSGFHLYSDHTLVAPYAANILLMVGCFWLQVFQHSVPHFPSTITVWLPACRQKQQSSCPCSKSWGRVNTWAWLFWLNQIIWVKNAVFDFFSWNCLQAKAQVTLFDTL